MSSSIGFRSTEVSADVVAEPADLSAIAVPGGRTDELQVGDDVANNAAGRAKAVGLSVM
jgi:hypothetical protein